MIKSVKHLVKFIFKQNFNVELDYTKIKFMLGQQAILASRALYPSIKKLHDAEVKVFSQWGEDGILDYLFTKLEISKPKIVEFGVGTFDERNSRFAAEFRNASVYMVDLNKDLISSVEKKEIYWKNSLFPVIDRITPNNALIHLKTAESIMKGIDVLSIDIDGNDYWVLKALNLEAVSIVVCEYNPIYGGDIACTVERNDEFDRTQAHYSWLHYGMSLRAAVSLLESKEFVFLGSNRVGNNAFFLKKELVNLISITFPEVNNLAEFTDWRVRESRDRHGKFNYLEIQEARKEISECTVLNLDLDKKIMFSQI